MQRSASCRSRRELSNAYLLAKFGFDTAENEHSEVCRIERKENMLREGDHVRIEVDMLQGRGSLTVNGLEVAESGRLRPSGAAS